jgi:hypothetical protein
MLRRSNITLVSFGKGSKNGINSNINDGFVYGASCWLRQHIPNKDITLASFGKKSKNGINDGVNNGVNDGINNGVNNGVNNRVL